MNLPFIIAQGGGGNAAAPAAAGVMVIVIVVLFMLVVIIGPVIALQVWACLSMQRALEQLPPQFRKQEPGMAWLLCIPLFNLVWNFFVYPKVSESYQAYFRAQGPGNVHNDCGRGIGLTVCILFACGLIPYVGILVFLAALVMLIVFVVQINGLKRLVPDNAAALMQAQVGPVPAYPGATPAASPYQAPASNVSSIPPIPPVPPTPQVPQLPPVSQDDENNPYRQQ